MNSDHGFECSQRRASIGKVALVNVGVLLWCLVATTGAAQSYKILHTFGTNVMGQLPYSTLVQGADGALYGTTDSGGSANLGQVFKVNPDGTGYTVLKDFTGSDGSWPDAGLVLSGTTLYGTTYAGGNDDNGTVFRINTDGTGFAVIKEFTGYDGAYPCARLVLSNAVLYGTTSESGALGAGTVFKLNTDGTGFTVLRYFSGDASGDDDGANPYGGVILCGSTLYGIGGSGGQYGFGTVFKINTDGSGFTVLKSFNPDSDGAGSYGALVSSGTSLYGTTSWEGNGGNGTVFKLDMNGSGFVVLKYFTDASEGASPSADLILSGTTLYGTTSSGGNGGNGTVFKLDTDGSGFAVLKDFANWTDGAHSYAGLLLSGTRLYGTATEGGDYGLGTVFKLQSDGSGFGVITHFEGGDGTYPTAEPALDGETIFGVTTDGGSSGNGTVFKINTDGSGYTVLKNFTNRLEGVRPIGGLILADGALYGSADNGGSNDCGTVFRMSIDGSSFSVLKEFGGTDGAYPRGALVLSGTTLYGTTYGGGTNENGTVFKANIDGSDFAVIKKFNGADGAHPSAGLVLSGTTLYGTTAYGGNSSLGTVFKLNTDGTGYAVLKNFSGSDGRYPRERLVLAGATLYGTTAGGGSSGGGTAFKLSTDGTGFSVIRNFTTIDGNPGGSLVISGERVYGITGSGGIESEGTVFEVGTNGSGYSVLKHFTWYDGSQPSGGLVLSGSTLYGTARRGGALDSGVLFSLSLLPGPPEIQLQPESQAVPLGTAVDFTVVASQIPASAFQWFFNGTNAIEGGTNYTLHLTDVQLPQAGGYSVVITSSYGSVTSLVATLTVQDPFIAGQPGSQYVHAGDEVQFDVVAGGTEPLSYRWFKDGVSLNDGENVSGASTATLTLSNVFGGDAAWYSVTISNTNSSVTSEMAFLAVRDPFVSIQPWNQSARVGQVAEFSVLAHGTALSYHWLKEGVPLNDGGRIFGAQTSTLTLSNVTATDAGGYTVSVSNSYAAVVSAVAQLAVNPMPAGAYSVLHEFSGDDGNLPSATLTLSEGTLYGTAVNGGADGFGTVFKVNTNGSGFSVLKNFGTGGGQFPFGGVIASAGSLYGALLGGGTPEICGEIFTLKNDGDGYSVLHQFSGSDGRAPMGRLLASDTTLFGTTYEGGISNRGTVFQIRTDGSAFKVLKEFTRHDGTYPRAGLVSSGTTLYGTVANGGSSGAGVVFRMNMDGSGYTVLKDFSGTDGSWPSDHLVLSGTTLYGTTRYGGSGSGTVFRMNTDGTGFTVLKQFTTNDVGIDPWGGLVLGGSTLYGTLFNGGVSVYGAIFKIGTNGDDYAVLKQFNGTSEGAYPYGLVLSGSSLYGLAQRGGSSDHGLVFSFSLTPVIQKPPQSQTTETGSTMCFSALVDGLPPLAYQWYFNGTNALNGCTNLDLELLNVQFSDRGVYSVVIFNAAGAVTSAPAMLNVIAPVERRPVPAINLMGDVGSALNVEYADALGFPANWLPLDTVNLSNAAQYYFDITKPLPPQRFYRAWQSEMPVVLPSLQLPYFVPAITLTGSIGDTVRMNCINAIGPIDAWVTLDTITLTNTSQLYFDTSGPWNPGRLYRIVPVP